MFCGMDVNAARCGSSRRRVDTSLRHGLGVSFFSGGWVVTGGLKWLSRGREVLQAMNKAMEGPICFVTCMAAPCMPMFDEVVTPTQQLAPLLR